MPKRKRIRSKPEVIMRADSEFSTELRKLGSFRFIKGLEKRRPSDAEMTRLLRRTSAWNQAKLELQTKSRKEDII